MKLQAKDKDIKDFDKSDIGKIKNSYLKKAIITGILSITISLVWIVLNIFYSLNWYEYISPIILLLFGIYFIINSKRIKLKEVNKYAYNKKTSK